MLLRERLGIVERHLRNSVAKRKAVLDAINKQRKGDGLPPLKADVGDWKSFWDLIKPYLPKLIDLLLALLLK